MKKPLLLAFSLLTVCAVFAGGKKETAPAEQTPSAYFEEETAPAEQTPSAYFEGDGGKDKSIAILPLNGTGIPAEQDSLLSVIQGEFMANFSDYSNIAVFDRDNLQNIYAELYSGYYDDDSQELDLGHLAPPDYFMNGNITKTTSGYALQVQISKTSDKIVAASYSGIWTFDELDNFTGIRRASSELLEKLGVKLTEAGRQKLTSAADVNTVNAQTALAKANTAPTEFEKMQYTYEAAAIDPSLKEAAQRLSTYQATMFEIPTFTAPSFTAPAFTLPEIQPVSTGNIGADARDELARYRANKAAIEEQQQTLLRQRDELLEQWQDFLIQLEDQRQPLHDQELRLFQRQAELVAMLRDAEAFYAEHPPFRIFYNPAAERYGGIDYENATVDLRSRIASEHTSVEALKDVLDALVNLNKSFTTVNNAYKEVNTVMAARFNQVESAMAAVKNALTEANDAGKQYAVAAVFTTSPEWTVPSGTNGYGAALTTAWSVDYPRTFSIAASLLNDTGAVIGHGEASLSNATSQGDLFKSETVFGWCEFKNVKIDDITDTLTVRVDIVNNRDVANAAITGYIAIEADGARIVAMEQQIAEQRAAQAAREAAQKAEERAAEAAREAARVYWATRFNSIGVAIGTAGTTTPIFFTSAKLTFSPFGNSFLEAGSDFGLVHSEWGVNDVAYLSIAPYLHLNVLMMIDTFFVYLGIGGGASFSRYTYPSEANIDPVETLTPSFDVNVGYLLPFAHSAVDFRWTLKTSNLKGVNNRFTIGYSYRFGTFD